MEELINSMVRFSAAMTLLGVQQVQNAMGAITDSQNAKNKFRTMLDSVTDAVNTHIDDTNKRTLDSVSKFGEEVVDTLNVKALDPREIVETTSDLMRKTTDSLTEMVKKATSEPSSSSTSSEPQPASEALKPKPARPTGTQ